MSGDPLVLLKPLRQALERIERKAQPLLADPNLLDGEEGQDLLSAIRSLEQQAQQAPSAMVTSTEIRQQLVAVNGSVSSARRGRPAKVADPADTEQIGLAL
jgi:CheY-like chemotaxis protein